MLPLHDNPDSARARKRIFNPARRATMHIEPTRVAALADPDRVVFLDIETTGLSWFYDDLTIVGWACAGKYSVYLAGNDPTPLLDVLRTATALVTFNGTMFDLRFLKKTFGDIRLPTTHIDLRFLSKRAGLTGGQKEIEKILGLQTRAGVEDVDGAGAVILWHRYLRGEKESLHRLVDYNRRDILGMCGILDEVLDRLHIHPDLWFSRPKYAEVARDMLSKPIDIPQRKAKARKIQTFERLFTGTAAQNATVIGIDLTGSETRPSGWCLLQGKKAETCRVSTDDEMFSRVVAARPALVSIDSPLSIPFGRIRVEDDDPGREQFGIMRCCERELKRRGVNVYPCLLPSMQGLTRRGMQLAARIRSAGIPVIESYPGAAQDIMGIPRKGAGEEFLKEGLADFGIRGPFLVTDVSHDELDAITSAIVGSFFLSGQYEAMRGPSENALIIPAPAGIREDTMVVGISGRICAGKTTAARILEQHGFAYSRFSLVIDEEIVAHGDVPDRAVRQRLGTEINRTRGQRWLCEKVLERVAGQKLIVVDGLRFPEDHAFFVERFGANFAHLHLKTKDELRMLRYQSSAQDGLPFDVADRQPVEAKINDLVMLATAILSNDFSIAELEENVLNSVRALALGEGRKCLSQLL